MVLFAANLIVKLKFGERLFAIVIYERDVVEEAEDGENLLGRVPIMKGLQKRKGLARSSSCKCLETKSKREWGKGEGKRARALDLESSSAKVEDDGSRFKRPPTAIFVTNGLAFDPPKKGFKRG